MKRAWNLTPGEWTDVLSTAGSAARLAERIAARRPVVPWTRLLLEYTADCQTVLDLGSGRGDHSALLAHNGLRPTLVDWSPQNIGFSREMFQLSGISGQFCVADITRSLPFGTSSIDAVFSCGVLEYFDPEQVDAIISEAFRVARKRVIVLVPNAFSVAYRVGKWYMERTGSWTWGGEVPSRTLKPAFERAGALRTTEMTVAARHSLNFLAMPLGPQIRRACLALFGSDDPAGPSWCRQGYLLVTIGDKRTGRAT